LRTLGQERGIAIGGIEGHVHSLVELPPTMSLSRLSID
jgi:REP element-mobilizing transposase RayT